MEQATNGLFRVHPVKDTNHPEFIQASWQLTLFAQHQKIKDVSRRRVKATNRGDQVHHGVVRKKSEYIRYDQSETAPTNAYD